MIGVSPVGAILFFRRDFMLKIDEYVVYKHDVCKIVSINNRNNLHIKI